MKTIIKLALSYYVSVWLIINCLVAYSAIGQSVSHRGKLDNAMLIELGIPSDYHRVYVIRFGFCAAGANKCGMALCEYLNHRLKLNDYVLTDVSVDSLLHFNNLLPTHLIKVSRQHLESLGLFSVHNYFIKRNKVQRIK